ncbi:MAG: hypothetical protein LBN34_08515 [Clostridiales Family XIII bacterium]|jgi:hypothetical protein|nr:hypothetical protein [Clostridiales Family XIII bacterium]
MASRNVLLNTEVSMKYGRGGGQASNLTSQKAPQRERTAREVAPARERRPSREVPYTKPLPKKAEPAAAGVIARPAVYVPAPVKNALTGAQIKLAVMVIFIGAVLLLGLIFSSAYAASIQHNINITMDDIARVEEDIANIKVDIEKASSVAVVEARAASELSMIYPTRDKYIYLDELPEPEYAVAQMIKDTNYGTQQ